ncbi:unnamed protein product, partial [Laminaria digitata]
FECVSTVTRNLSGAWPVCQCCSAGLGVPCLNCLDAPGVGTRSVVTLASARPFFHARKRINLFFCFSQVIVRRETAAVRHPRIPSTICRSLSSTTLETLP